MSRLLTVLSRHKQPFRLASSSSSSPAFTLTRLLLVVPAKLCLARRLKRNWKHREWDDRKIPFVPEAFSSTTATLVEKMCTKLVPLCWKNIFMLRKASVCNQRQRTINHTRERLRCALCLIVVSGFALLAGNFRANNSLLTRWRQESSLPCHLRARRWKAESCGRNLGFRQKCSLWKIMKRWRNKLGITNWYFNFNDVLNSFPYVIARKPHRLISQIFNQLKFVGIRKYSSIVSID